MTTIATLFRLKYPEVSLDSMIDDELLLELNEQDAREMAGVSSNDVSSAAEDSVENVAGRLCSQVGTEDEATDDDDIWSDNPSCAFQ